MENYQKFRIASFHISGENLKSSEAMESWRAHIHNSGVVATAEAFSSAPFSANSTLYTVTRPYMSIYEHSTPASVSDAILSFSYDRRNASLNTGISYALHLISHGQSRIRANGGEFIAVAGDCFLRDMRESDTHEHSGGEHRLAAVFLPDLVLDRHLPGLEECTNKPLQSDWGHALSATMKAVTNPTALDTLHGSPDALAEHLCYLLALALPGGATLPMSTYKRSVFQRLMVSVRENSADPEFDIKCLAQEFGMAVPTLYAAFASAGTTFQTELMQQRLMQAKQLLENRRVHRKNINEIAYLSGFRNAGHFTTVFRKRFGITPTAYRTIYHG